MSEQKFNQASNLLKHWRTTQVGTVEEIQARKDVSNSLDDLRGILEAAIKNATGKDVIQIIKQERGDK